MNLPLRVASKIKADENGCWLWQGAVTSTGYGNMVVRVGGIKRWMKPHRFVYEQLVGPITQAHIDHLCRVPLCVNPLHLEPVTPKENITRGIGHGKEPQCPQGHVYDKENTYENRGKRYCRSCRRGRNKEIESRRQHSRAAQHS